MILFDAVEIDQDPDTGALHRVAHHHHRGPAPALLGPWRQAGLVGVAMIGLGLFLAFGMQTRVF